MNAKQYQYRFQELEITTGIIENFIGYQEGPSPEPIREIIKKMIEIAPQYCDIKGGYVIIDQLNINKENQTISLKDTLFETKKIITGQLRTSDSAALFLCTAGPGIGDYSKALMSNGDLLEGYIADAIGSETVEAAMEKIQDELEQEVLSDGLKITDRYSPGYCGWTVAEQQKLFSFFPANFL